MSTAPDYTPGTSFADDEANNVAGRSLVKTSSLDTEFANVSTSINDINANLQAIQRDDTKLKDGIIEPYALSEQTNALIAVGGTTPRGTWQPDTDYKYKDLIQRNNIAQICLQAHNSGSLFTQSFWLPISGDGTSAANAAAAAASASAASTSASNASASASTATSAASAASTSATNAATSATNASNSASSASTSELNASTSATEAAASAASITAPENNASDPNRTSFSSTKAASPEWVRALALIKQGSQINTNGAAAYDFAIPSVAKRVVLNINAASTNGSSIPLVQLGNGTPVTTGYQANISTGATNNGTTNGFNLSTVGISAGGIYNATITLTNISGNIWAAETVFSSPSGNSGSFGNGIISLSGALTVVRLTTVNGTDLYDAGTACAAWEF